VYNPTFFSIIVGTDLPFLSRLKKSRIPYGKWHYYEIVLFYLVSGWVKNGPACLIHGFFRLQGLSKPLGIMKHIFTGSGFVSIYGLVSNKVLKIWFVPCSGGGPNTEFWTFTFKMFLKLSKFTCSHDACDELVDWHVHFYEFSFLWHGFYLWKRVVESFRLWKVLD